MLIADIGRLGIAGIIVILGLFACAAMLIAFRTQQRNGRWTRERADRDREGESNET